MCKMLRQLPLKSRPIEKVKYMALEPLRSSSAFGDNERVKLVETIHLPRKWYNMLMLRLFLLHRSYCMLPCLHISVNLNYCSILHFSEISTIPLTFPSSFLLQIRVITLFISKFYSYSTFYPPSIYRIVLQSLYRTSSSQSQYPLVKKE